MNPQIAVQSPRSKVQGLLKLTIAGLVLSGAMLIGFGLWTNSGCSVLQTPVAKAIGAPTPAQVTAATTQVSADQSALPPEAAAVTQAQATVAAATTQPGGATTAQLAALTTAQATLTAGQTRLTTDMASLNALLVQTSNAITAAQGQINQIGATVGTISPQAGLLTSPITAGIGALLLSLLTTGAYATGKSVAAGGTATDNQTTLLGQLTTSLVSTASTVNQVLTQIHATHSLTPNTPVTAVSNVQSPTSNVATTGTPASVVAPTAAVAS